MLSPEDHFWQLAEPLQAGADVTRSTMMGFPCLRFEGRFFASFDRRTQQMVVKLSAARVEDLIESGAGTPFAPNGRRFREWVAISPDAARDWQAILDEALSFVRVAKDEALAPPMRRRVRH